MLFDSDLWFRVPISEEVHVPIRTRARARASAGVSMSRTACGIVLLASLGFCIPSSLEKWGHAMHALVGTEVLVAPSSGSWCSEH